MSTPRPTTARVRPKVMTLTPAAAERVKSIMASKGPEVAGLKIGIKKGGCAGMEIGRASCRERVCVPV